MAAFSSLYRGSRSIRDGIWLDLPVFCALDPRLDNDFDDNTGVETLMDGRLSAAGSMSGMMMSGGSATESRAAEWRRATRRAVHEMHKINAQSYAIANPELNRWPGHREVGQ